MLTKDATLLAIIMFRCRWNYQRLVANQLTVIDASGNINPELVANYGLFLEELFSHRWASNDTHLMELANNVNQEVKGLLTAHFAFNRDSAVLSSSLMELALLGNLERLLPEKQSTVEGKLQGKDLVDSLGAAHKMLKILRP